MSNHVEAQKFDAELRLLCDKYEVFIKEVSRRKNKPNDKISFREYTLSVKIVEEGMEHDLIE